MILPAPFVNRQAARTSIAACTLTLLAACTVGPDFDAPPEPTSQHYDQSAEDQLAATGGAPGVQHIRFDRKVGGDWWSGFGSAKLDEIMRRAIDGNLDLAAADATISQAAETVKVAEGGLYPQVDFGAQI